MSTERWLRLERLFVDALEHPEDGRRAFVLQQCGDDEVLRADALSLLSAAKASNEFMAASAFERLAQAVGVEGWTLTPGERIGAYTVIGRLAAGSSGEVWRARDDRFGRDVAIKVLLPHLSEDPARVRRFADEVRAVGSLNHPNVLAVYDVGEHEGLPYLVSECLTGQSLRAKLVQGAVPAHDVARIALGIAQGLAAAHRRGLVHRDLKPENVFVTSDGSVKVLDFGVAKLHGARVPDQTRSDTLSGFVVGTAGYMAPEQVRAEEVDARADLFALGAMMYEMLAGVAPFTRGNTIDTLHAVLSSDPPDVTEACPGVPGELALIVSRLLQKDREARFQSAADLAWALERPGAPRGQAARRNEARRVPAWILAVVAAGGLGALAVWIGARATAPPSNSTAVTRFSWTLPAGVGLVSPPAVAPDGRTVTFIGERNGIPSLFLRALDGVETSEVEGTAGAMQPFWSPDSKWIGFFARRRLMKVSSSGGPPITIADASQSVSVRTERGASWGRNDEIVYGPGFNPPALFSVRASGGATAPATTLAAERGETAHLFPWFLPDGQHFLYQARGITDQRGVFVGALEGGAASTPLVAVDSNAMYLPDVGSDQGVLVFAVNGHLTAQRFDPARRTLAGAAQPLGIDVGRETFFAPATFGASSTVLAYAGQLSYGGEIKVLAAGGSAPALFAERDEQQWPRISPDGTRIAWLRIDPVQGADIWVSDLARRTKTRVTTAPERDLMHVWSPDGRELAYRPDVEDRTRLSVMAADGSGASRDLVCPRATCQPTDWSSDGRELLVNASDGGNMDVWTLAVSEGGRTRPVLESRFNERDARLSPDRRWIAYVSDETGKPEISVRGFVGSEPRRYTVSPSGGDQVVWARDGRALYYVDPGGRLQKAGVREVNGGLVFEPPVALPVAIGSGHANTQYDLAPDGRIFFLDPTPMPAPTEIQVVMGWQALLHR